MEEAEAASARGGWASAPAPTLAPVRSTFAGGACCEPALRAAGGRFPRTSAGGPTAAADEAAAPAPEPDEDDDDEKSLGPAFSSPAVRGRASKDKGPPDAAAAAAADARGPPAASAADAERRADPASAVQRTGADPARTSYRRILPWPSPATTTEPLLL